MESMSERRLAEGELIGGGPLDQAAEEPPEPPTARTHSRETRCVKGGYHCDSTELLRSSFSGPK